MDENDSVVGVIAKTHPHMVESVILVERVIQLLNNSEGERVTQYRRNQLFHDRIPVLLDGSAFIDREWCFGDTLKSFVLTIDGVEFVVPVRSLPTGFGLITALSSSNRTRSANFNLTAEVADFFHDYEEIFGGI